MSDFEWFKWNPAIYAADTMHLNPYQDGCYRRLIDHYMMTRQPLPDNDAALARIVGDSEANWVAMARAIVRPFFRSINGRLHHAFCDKTLNSQDVMAKSLSENGKKGAERRWNKINYIDSHPIAPPNAPPNGRLMLDREEGEEGEEEERKILPLVKTPELIETCSKDSRHFENFETEVAEWNRIAELHGLPRCQVLTPQRKAALKARLKDCGGSSGWLDACRMVSESDFLTGKKTDWKASFDFMLQKKSFTKILEGAYANHDAPAKPSKGSGDYFSGLVAAVNTQMNRKGNEDAEDYSPLGKL